MTTEQSSVIRTRDDISREILVALCNGPLKRADIFYKFRLSSSQLKGYEAYLLERGLIAVDGRQWAITEKGRQYGTALNTANEILESGV